MKFAIYFFVLASLFLLNHAKAAELTCIQTDDYRQVWLVYKATITPRSELLNLEVRLEGKELMSKHTGLTKGSPTSSTSPTFKGYVQHSSISHFIHPGNRAEFDIDLVVPGDLISKTGQKFSAYTRMRQAPQPQSMIWRVECMVK